MSLTALISSTILAVLIDRHLLDRVLGTASPFGSRETIAQLAKAGNTFCLLVPALCFSQIAADFVLFPAGTGYLYPLAFMMFVVIFALGEDALFAGSPGFPLWNRLSQRAAVLSVLLGFMTIVPYTGTFAGQGVSLAKATLAGCFTGIVFGAVLLLYTGIWQKQGPDRPRAAHLSLARDFTLAALLALALGGFSGVRVMGW